MLTGLVIDSAGVDGSLFGTSESSDSGSFYRSPFKTLKEQ